MIYIAVQLIQIFSAHGSSQPRESEVVQEVLADLKTKSLYWCGKMTTMTSSYLTGGKYIVLLPLQFLKTTDIK